MVGYIGKTTNGLGTVIEAYADAEREDMLGPMPGEVVAYHPERGTVDVQPLFMRRKWDGSPLLYPVLLEVPLDQPRSGSAGLTMPVPTGTRVMLTPMMRSGENYESDGDGSPSDARSFNLSDMRASLAGGDSLSAPMANVDPDNTHLRFDADGNFGVRGSPDGKFAIEGSEGDVYELIATFMELVASDQLQIAYGSSAGTGHALQNRAQLMEIAGKIRAMAL